MTRPHRWEKRVALAMLPVGATMTLLSAVAVPLVALLALDTLVRWPPDAVVLLAWCLGAAIVAGRNTVGSIEVMSSFEWRPLVPVLLWSAAVIALYPGWWAAS